MGNREPLLHQKNLISFLRLFLGLIEKNISLSTQENVGKNIFWKVTNPKSLSELPSPRKPDSLFPSFILAFFFPFSPSLHLQSEEYTSESTSNNGMNTLQMWSTRGSVYLFLFTYFIFYFLFFSLFYSYAGFASTVLAQLRYFLFEILLIVLAMQSDGIKVLISEEIQVPLSFWTISRPRRI